MSKLDGLHVEAFSDALAHAIGEARVTHALFSTFTLDPGFFELHVLPLLFPNWSFSHVDKAKRIQLEQGLIDGPKVAVYYDRSGLAAEATPAHLGWSRIDVGRKTGIFHPKVILMLVERYNEDTEEWLKSLIVGISSANITRNGWWENVEAGHFTELFSAEHRVSRTSIRTDLLWLIRQLRASLPDRAEEPVLDAIHTFVRDRTNRNEFEHRSVKGRYLERIFAGQTDFPTWILEIGLDRGNYNLEVISPFFDGKHASTLMKLIDALQPRCTRVYSPVDAEGVVQVDEEAYRAIAELPGVQWAQLPDEFVRRAGNANSARLSNRGVHAKVYRLWGRDEGEVVIVGSVNLTAPAHSKASAGNLEVAILVDHTDRHNRQWWLQVDDTKREHFVDIGKQSEREGVSQIPVDLSVEYDWRHDHLRLRCSESGTSVKFFDPTDRLLFEHTFDESEVWESRPADDAACIREALRSSSILIARMDDREWPVLVREANCGFKPSLLSQLTAEEILQYWALLTPEQRQAYILDKLRNETGEDGLAVGSRSERFLGGATIFERFSAVFHAFGCLRRAIEEAIENDREDEAETRLFGRAYDSLPELLRRLREDEQTDAVRAYVTMLCVRQVRKHLQSKYGAFWNVRKNLHPLLDGPLQQLSDLRDGLGLDPVEEAKFFEWYERAFLMDMTPRGGGEV